MTGQQLFERLGYIQPAYVAEAEAFRVTPRRWLRLTAIAACLCLLAALTVNTLGRFGYDFRAGCGAWPGTIVEGIYYYNVPHSGVWRYVPGEEPEKLLSTYWEEGWLVNDYGIYYKQGRSLYVREHETGQRQKLYTASRRYCTHIGFDLLADGSVVVTLYDKHAQTRSELLLDGRSGAVLETLSEPTLYKDFAISYARAHITVGQRQLELVPAEESSFGYGHLFDLVEDDKSVLPEGSLAEQYDQLDAGADHLLLLLRETEGGDTRLYLRLRPNGQDQLLTLPAQYYCGGIDCFLFYPEEDQVWCLALDSGESWALEKDSDGQIYEFTTDGTWLYSTVPWGEGHTCWQLRYDTSGRPVGMTLVREDLGKSAAATDS